MAGNGPAAMRKNEQSNMHHQLREAARTINALAKQEGDVHLAVCRAIAGAMDLVRKTGTVPFRDWADANLRKPDGSRWAHSTLYNLASFGRDPAKLEHRRHLVRESDRDIRKTIRKANAAILQGAQAVSGTVLDRQVESLMFAWRNAGPEARKLFLEKISNTLAEAA